MYTAKNSRVNRNVIFDSGNSYGHEIDIIQPYNHQKYVVIDSDNEYDRYHDDDGFIHKSNQHQRTRKYSYNFNSQQVKERQHKMESKEIDQVEYSIKCLQNQCKQLEQKISNLIKEEAILSVELRAKERRKIKGIQAKKKRKNQERVENNKVKIQNSWVRVQNWKETDSNCNKMIAMLNNKKIATLTDLDCQKQCKQQQTIEQQPSIPQMKKKKSAKGKQNAGSSEKQQKKRKDRMQSAIKSKKMR